MGLLPGLMGAVSILSKSRPPFSTSLVLALIGAALAVNGYTLLFRLPFLHGSH